jgi:LysR family transcriptional regulator, glycine cleavage system transcriptional activator
MTTPPARLPPLNALRVFHMVVRHRSFRAAAEVLSVSPQAVSQQIKLLEDTLRTPLFERKGRTIEPNEQAILLAHFVQAGFDEFAEGVRRISNTGSRHRINLNVSPYFATRYLLDRLHRFSAIMPDADLRLTTMVNLPDFAGDDVDVAIQWGFGTWTQYDQSLLLRDYKIICCTPEIAERIKRPEDLRQQKLLHPVLAPRLWARILASMGVEMPDRKGDLRFQDAATLRQATCAGLGIGLLSETDAAEDLKSGKLAAPFGVDPMHAMPEADIPGFYLVLPRAHRRVKEINSFCRWIQGENWAVPQSLHAP